MSVYNGCDIKMQQWQRNMKKRRRKQSVKNNEQRVEQKKLIKLIKIETITQSLLLLLHRMKAFNRRALILQIPSNELMI